MNSPKRHGEHDPSCGRKPYTKPHVQIYGDLREITQMVGNTGNNDSGTGNTKRTQA